MYYVALSVSPRWVSTTLTHSEWTHLLSYWEMSFFPIVLASISTSGRRWTSCFLQDKILRKSEAVNDCHGIRVSVTHTNTTDSFVWNSLESFWILLGFFYGNWPWGDIILFISRFNFLPNFFLRNFTNFTQWDRKVVSRPLLLFNFIK